MDNFKEEQRAVNVQANQEINTMESSLNKELDGFQSEIDKKFDILQESISKLTNQLVHIEEENPEKECLIDTIVEEEYKQQDEVISPLLTEEGSGKETVEGTQEPILQSIDPESFATVRNFATVFLVAKFSFWFSFLYYSSFVFYAKACTVQYFVFL